MLILSFLAFLPFPSLLASNMQGTDIDNQHQHRFSRLSFTIWVFALWTRGLFVVFIIFMLNLNLSVSVYIKNCTVNFTDILFVVSLHFYPIASPNFEIKRKVSNSNFGFMCMSGGKIRTYKIL